MAFFMSGFRRKTSQDELLKNLYFLESRKNVQESKEKDLRANFATGSQIPQTICRPWSSPYGSACSGCTAVLTKVGGSCRRFSLLDPGLLILCVSADLVQEEKVDELILPVGQLLFQVFKPRHQGLLPCPYVPSTGMAYFFKICCQVCEGVHLILRKK